MMILANGKHNIRLSLEENVVSSLVIENPALLSEVILGLLDAVDGKESDFVFSENDKVLKMDKTFAIQLDPFHIDLNTTKIRNRIYAEMESIAQDYILHKDTINSEIVRVMDRICNQLMYSNVSYNMNFEWQSLFKMYGVGIVQADLDIKETIAEYIKIATSIMRYKAIAFVHLRDYMSANDVSELIELAHYNKLNLILIDSHEVELLPGEKRCIIDKDLCVIM